MQCSTTPPRHLIRLAPPARITRQQDARKLPGSLTWLALAAGLALFAGTGTVWAQSIVSGQPVSPPEPGNPAGRGGPITVGPEPQVKQPQSPPPVLPGAAARSDRVAPATGTAIADPNAALFDAINRGDIAAARDALDRGADLQAHNVLGMTPLDLSVDLGRNDITFLLLSLRNGDLPASTRTATGTAPAAPGGKPAPASAKPAPAATRVATHTPAKPPAQTAQAAPAAPRLFAGDGGTPNPTAGFLGFNNRP